MNSKQKIEKGVYFIFAPNQNKVKIGRSTNIQRRFNQLKTGFMDSGYLLLGILTEEEVELERELHEKFLSLRDNGEWFFLTRELKEFILSCEYIYPRVLKYSNLNEFREKLVYNSTDLKEMAQTTFHISKVVLLPLILGIIGGIIGYYDLMYSPELGEKNKLFTIILLVFYPLITIRLSYDIIQYGTISEGIVFFSLLVGVVLIELMNILFNFEQSTTRLFRIIIISVFIPIAKLIALITILTIKDSKSKTNFLSFAHEQNYQISDLLDHKQKVKNRIIKTRKIYVNVYKAVVCTTYLSFFFGLFIFAKNWNIAKSIELFTLSFAFISFGLKELKIWKNNFINRFSLVGISFLFLSFSFFDDQNLEDWRYYLTSMTFCTLPLIITGLYYGSYQRHGSIILCEINKSIERKTTANNA